MLLQATKLHSYAATAIYALCRFLETIGLLVLNRDHYNKETKMRKSRTTLLKNSGARINAMALRYSVAKSMQYRRKLENNALPLNPDVLGHHFY